MKKTMVSKDMKELIISKELISEVLGIKLEDIVDFKMFMNELFYYRELLFRADCQGKISNRRDSIQQSINIYEFAFKCKEWALKKEFIVSSSPTQKKEFTSLAQNFNMNQLYYGKNQFYALTEIEAIIKACNWILEENK